jgi:hypothetical protein
MQRCWAEIKLSCEGGVIIGGVEIYQEGKSIDRNKGLVTLDWKFEMRNVNPDPMIAMIGSLR